MRISKIRKLIQLLEETGITEIEIKEGEESVRLSRQGMVVTAHPIAPIAIPAAKEAPVAVSPEPITPIAASNQHTIKSPMVGTFYSKRSPEAAPFISLGQTVQKGAVLCLLEAMKMFNEVEADISGTIVKILASDGEPVEYDQPLFIIEA